MPDWNVACVCVFQMSTTTENGMGGPWSTNQEKTYKKVKKERANTLTRALTVFW